MTEIHLRGAKKAVYLAWGSALGYGQPDITFEDGTDEDYIMHCEICTKYSADPFDPPHGDPEPWDGTIIDLSQYEDEKVYSEQCTYEFESIGYEKLSGCLDIDIQTKNIPEEGWPGFVKKYSKGTMLLDDLIWGDEEDFDDEVLDAEEAESEKADEETSCDDEDLNEEEFVFDF